jgi:leader peptidase (prepilin peptidase)/N-methyltransferase
VTWLWAAGGVLAGAGIGAAMASGWYRRAGEPTWLSLRWWLLLLAPTLAISWAAAAKMGWWALPVMAFAAGGSTAAVVDLEVHRLPNPLVGATTAVTGIGLLVAAAGTGEWHPAARAAAAAAAVFVLFLVMGVVGSLGGGDIKLGPSIGAVLGMHSLAAVAVGLMAGFALAGVLGVVLAIRGPHHRPWWKTWVPMGPGLVAGTLITTIALQAPA